MLHGNLRKHAEQRLAVHPENQPRSAASDTRARPWPSHHSCDLTRLVLQKKTMPDSTPEHEHLALQRVPVYEVQLNGFLERERDRLDSVALDVHLACASLRMGLAKRVRRDLPPNPGEHAGALVLQGLLRKQLSALKQEYRSAAHWHEVTLQPMVLAAHAGRRGAALGEGATPADRRASQSAFIAGPLGETCLRLTNSRGKFVQASVESVERMPGRVDDALFRTRTHVQGRAFQALHHAQASIAAFLRWDEQKTLRIDAQPEFEPRTLNG